MACQGERGVRSCCSKALLFEKTRKQDVFAGRGLVLTSLLFRRKKSVKTAVLTFSNKLHFSPSDALEIFSPSLLCVFTSAQRTPR